MTTEARDPTYTSPSQSFISKGDTGESAFVFEQVGTLASPEAGSLRANDRKAKTLQKAGCAGYYSGDNGTFGPDLTVDLTDTTTVDNDLTVFVDALGQRWKRSFSGGICVDYAGAYGNGTTSDSAVFQTLFDLIQDGGLVYGTYGKTYRFDSEVVIPDRGPGTSASVHAPRYRPSIFNGRGCQINIADNTAGFVLHGATVKWKLKNFKIGYTTLQPITSTDAVCIMTRDDSVTATTSANVQWLLDFDNITFENCYKGIGQDPDNVQDVTIWSSVFRNLYGSLCSGNWLEINGSKGSPSPAGSTGNLYENVVFFSSSNEESPIHLYRPVGSIFNYVEINSYTVLDVNEPAINFETPQGMVINSVHLESISVEVDQGSMIKTIGEGGIIEIDGLSITNSTLDAGVGNEGFILSNSGCMVSVGPIYFGGSVGTTVASGTGYALINNSSNRGIIRYESAFHKWGLNSSVLWNRTSSDTEIVEPRNMDFFVFSKSITSSAVTDFDEQFVAPYDAYIVFTSMNADTEWDNAGATVNWFPAVVINGVSAFNHEAPSDNRIRGWYRGINGSSAISILRGDLITATVGASASSDAYPYLTTFTVGIARKTPE